MRVSKKTEFACTAKSEDNFVLFLSSITWHPALQNVDLELPGWTPICYDPPSLCRKIIPMKVLDNILSNTNDKKQFKFNHDLTIIIIVTLACLVPFLDKAFHIDDPLYIWAARHIQTNPLDFYGFTVNWYGREEPMFEVMKNPPLASYYIALVSGLFGWAEITMHLAFLIPVIAAVTGTYYLAGKFCSTPLLATLVSLVTPVFLLSSTTVMCDIMMLSFWVWATLIWMRGVERNSILTLILAAILIALCSLTKYYGMCLIPLLLIYSLAKKRNLGLWTLYLLIPVFILAMYQWMTLNLYGKGLLLDASSYALEQQKIEVSQLFLKSITGLFFTGGCFISVLFSSLLLRRKILAIGALITLPLIAYYLYKLVPDGLIYNHNNRLNWLFIAQVYLFAIAGTIVLFLAFSDLWRSKNADSLLLFLWMVGTFMFATFLNWTINGRSILPMFPVIGVLVLRHIEQRSTLHNLTSSKIFFLPLIPALLIALSVTWADYKWADNARSEAASINHSYQNQHGKVWFSGHWGFQYYMQKYGAKALDEDRSIITRGDIVITPSDNTNAYSMPEDTFNLVQVYKIAPLSWLSTLNSSTGAGFYSSKWGPLPFVFGPVPEAEYAVFIANGEL